VPVQGGADWSWVGWDATTDALPAVDWDQIDAIVHLAAPRSLFAFPAQAQSIFDTSVGATFQLLQAAASHARIRRFVLASTGNVLGPQEGYAAEDDTLYAPGSFYGTAKACAELLSRAYADLVATAVLRFYHPYGPGGDRFLINKLLDAVAEGREVTIEGEHGILLNPVWIDDLANGIRLAVESAKTGIFHLGGPETVCLRSLAELMGELVGRVPSFRILPPKRGEPHVCRFDRSTAELGYDPREGVRTGLQKLIASRGNR
jgi:nucleoside-diphosphate-sugar epimerase